METEAVLAWLDNVVPTQTGEQLSELERVILKQVWLGRKYLEIADTYGCTEGHAKDVGSGLWKLLSKVTRQKITKSNCRRVLEKCVRKASAMSGFLDCSSDYSKLDYPKTSDSFSNNFSNNSSNNGCSQANLSFNGKTQMITQTQDNHFIGRSTALSHIHHLKNQGNKLIVIQGEGGNGKTTLAQRYLYTQHFHHQQLQPNQFDIVLEVLIAKEIQNITPAQRVVEEWLKYDFSEEVSDEFGVNLARLKRQLQNQNRSVGILIDNLEPVLDTQGKFIKSHRDYVELLRILTSATVNSFTLITSRDRLCEPELNVEHYRLPGLDMTAWKEFFYSRGIETNSDTLEKIHRVYGGNAKAMGILCGAIAEDFEGDAIVYWKENHADPLAFTDLKNLVVGQINRLQVLDPQAYKLLCRLGCYRYQDVSTVSLQGLSALLWDTPVEEHNQIVTSLKNRSLIESKKGKYWLHPIIRTEAISRLRNSKDWEMANIKAAEFWTDKIKSIENLKDALQALEAYYHYIAINQFELAGKVILKSRDNQWEQFLPLGSTLYRMGFSKPILNAINLIISKTISNTSYHSHLSELHNILGDLYWINGKVQLAIECQDKAIGIATNSLSSLNILNINHIDKNIIINNTNNELTYYYLKMLEVDSILSMGIYNIDLWELEKAVNYFQQVITLTQNTKHHAWSEKASVCLALVYAYLNQPKSSYILADGAYKEMKIDEIDGTVASAISYRLSNHPQNCSHDISHNIYETDTSQKTGRLTYFIHILGQTYLNLNDLERAQEIFSKTLKLAQESHYTQVQANTLTSYGQIYRKLSKYKLALEHHHQAVELLENIGAKCDLAQAYFQLGLTYRKMKDFSASKILFHKANNIFQKMGAKKQINRLLDID